MCASYRERRGGRDEASRESTFLGRASASTPVPTRRRRHAGGPCGEHEPGGDGPTTVNSFGTMTSSGVVNTRTLNAPIVVEGVTVDSWISDMKVDPFVTNNIVVTNNTGATQTFIATVLLLGFGLLGLAASRRR